MNRVWGAIAFIFSPVVHAYICHQRNRLHSQARPLYPSERAPLETYFSAKLLGDVRVFIADPLPIPDPPFASVARRLGLDFPRPSTVEAITFDHVIASRKPLSSSVLFHELVHVIQYRHLGVRAFACRYTQGFLQTRDYFRIPLEQCAFNLQFRYETEPEPFNVEAETLHTLR